MGGVALSKGVWPLSALDRILGAFQVPLSPGCLVVGMAAILAVGSRYFSGRGLGQCQRLLPAHVFAWISTGSDVGIATLKPEGAQKRQGRTGSRQTARESADFEILGTITPQGAIRKRCLGCVEGYKKIETCDSGPEMGEGACPLWRFRMGSTRKAGRGSRLKAIRAYCLWCMNGSTGEVRGCKDESCALRPFRFGKRPSTVARREQK